MSNKMNNPQSMAGNQDLSRRKLLAAWAAVASASVIGSNRDLQNSAAADSVTAIMAAENNATGSHNGPPQSDHSNTFYIMPIWEGGLDRLGTTDEQYRAEIAKMKKQFGSGNDYNKLGFASIYRAGNLPLLLRQLRVFQKENIHRGVIFAMQTHNGGLINPDGDLRNYQWRLDGKTWRGVPGPVQGRDTLVVTPSRYATAIREQMQRKARHWSRDIKAAMRAYPGTIAVINFCIEEELAIGGTVSNEYLGDYSPFAVTEFRDWLRHRGLYAPGGRYAGQGAPESITGDFISVDGHRVSPFYDDPTPDKSNRAGRTFNATFGTGFKSWTLAYWDLEKYPDPITNPKFNPSPMKGRGSTEGGFDAPRVRNHSRWWRAWDWTCQGNNNSYPPGNPAHPGYGFRECEVAHFVQDVASLLIAEGLPKELLYAHQIPAELLGNAPAGARRALSSASTIWSGYLPQNRHVGITRFGSLNPNMVTQYSHNWGIFEWHPAPNVPADSPVLYDAALRDLRMFVSNGCHVLFPGWWHMHKVGKTFPLNDSSFAKAIHAFLAEQRNVPHWSQS